MPDLEKIMQGAVDVSDVTLFILTVTLESEKFQRLLKEMKPKL